MWQPCFHELLQDCISDSANGEVAGQEVRWALEALLHDACCCFHMQIGALSRLAEAHNISIQA